MAESQEVRQRESETLVVSPHIEERLQDVTERIVAAFAPQCIILFGSHAYGQPHPDSDVDLLVVIESDERPAARATRVSRLLRPRPFPMDIVVRTPQEVQKRLEMGDYFIREVFEQGRVLYERGTCPSWYAFTSYGAPKGLTSAK